MARLMAAGSVVTTPWWWEAAPLQERAQPLPASIDVAIVGGGYTGLSAALTLARAGRAVAVLDAQRPGEGASSRNGGMIGSGHRVGFAAASERFGAPLARRLLQEGNDALAYTTGLIEREAIACHFRRSGRFRGAWSRAHYEAMQRELDTLQREIGLDATMVPKERVPDEVATTHYHGGCIFHRHGGLHPGLFHRGLLERAEAAGAQVFGHAPVQSIESAGGKHRLATPRGTVEAGEVIVATNGYTKAGTPFFSKRVVPAASYLIATEELGENRVRALIPGGRMIVETRARHCYYRASPDGKRLLLG
ncbi:MAG TPA: FAD-dependent oxidoreductase, partial [Kiloniellales bacterium]|nr:FAD-dependent oxidoreductase [Kiloniellales bacterium]